MFDNKRYITRGIQAEIPLEFQIFMWECVDRMPEPKDYFQVFKFEDSGGLQKIVHFSEQPEYCMNYFIPCSNPISAKVYVIDDGDHSTMLLSSEY
ncbi:MAG: DUF960 domain-containing protein [Ruminococcus flavefaciens]|nr:DUF960 domain-containing protein [Ruminococcus flavefaciens]